MKNLKNIAPMIALTCLIYAHTSYADLGSDMQVAANSARQHGTLRADQAELSLKEAHAARGNVGRFALESLGGLATTGVTAFVSYGVVCDGRMCDAGLGLTIASSLFLSPLMVNTIGGAMGGQGSYLGALIGGVVPWGSVAAEKEALVLALVMQPFTAATMYEIESHTVASRTLEKLGITRPRLGAIPLSHGGSIVGATMSFSGEL